MTLEERAACIADLSLESSVRGAERRRRIYERALKMLTEATLIQRDALSGLVDWCKEGCPDGGAHALTEARAALANIKAKAIEETPAMPLNEDIRDELKRTARALAYAADAVRSVQERIGANVMTPEALTHIQKAEGLLLDARENL